ncbi:MAG TPA: LptF/LptG family permease [Thermodesulfovibrio thiophilus]|uniref:LptF/LptG family permease n=1 Tax=Thermodesulfovibrio thiophilus TaxID=340095 RepID=UPI00041E6B33|nr:LptF/LptG family permease [Thermodesulfovibrio thiophilus]HHW20209.1 YjgP/YjgQ family permease [Thermodesulfovibrio thiophilus]HOA83022.1 LptF/LptG family permease [Thermodesulfovibrio thiophilus]HQA03478.1 LptF/LptG family permease [Thermodesulfovibrio thiophilus]HQD36097.1 LptF/LptG family permease [Thermodesulfovibrio thiophilus]
MTLIHKALTFELLQNIILSVIFLNAVLIIEKLLKLSKIFASVGIDLFDLILLIIFLQPGLLIFTIPMALLLSILLTYGRIQTDNEMTIFMVSGMPYKKAFRPAIYIGYIAFFLAILMSSYLAPAGVSLMREKVLTILAERAPMGLEEGVFNQGFKDITIFVKQKPDSVHLKDVVIFDERKNDTKIVIAKEGVIKKEKDNINLSLLDGKAYFNKKLFLNEVSFKEYIFRLSPDIEPLAKKIGELSLFELITKINTDKLKQIDYKLELYKRLSFPMLCIISVFLSPSLCILIGRSGRLGGVTIGLAIFAIYYIFMIYGANLAKSGKVSAEVGSLVPVIIMAVAAFTLYRKIKI